MFIKTMTLIDYVALLKLLQKWQKDINVMADRDTYSMIVEGFMNQCKISQSKDEKYSHSLTYFLFLSTKIGLIEKNLVKFIASEISVNSLPMEIDSLVSMLFSLYRL